MTNTRNPHRNSPGARLTLLLYAFVGVVLPLGEVFHTHARPHGPEWHAEGDSCEDTLAFSDCALLRIGTTPGLPATGNAHVTRDAQAFVPPRPATFVAPSADLSGSALPRAPPAA